MRSVALLVCVVIAGGCTRSLANSYACSDSSQCIFEGRSGRCEPTGACSFPDDSCPSHWRYGDLGPGPVAGSCVVVDDADLGTGMSPDLGTGSAMVTRVGSSKLAPSAPTGGTAAIIARPAGLAAGDLLFAIVYSSDSTSAISAPQGWTTHADLDGTSFRAAWFYKAFATSDPSPISFGVTHSPATVAAVIVAYRGVDSATPIDASMTRQFLAMPYVAPSITTTRANDMLLAMFVDQTQGPTLSAPAGMTTVVDDAAIVVFDGLQATAGATGTKSVGGLPGAGAVDFVALAPTR
jgi:hypothetical protein